jgi:hypothetical protein
MTYKVYHLIKLQYISEPKSNARKGEMTIKYTDLFTDNKNIGTKS